MKTKHRTSSRAKKRKGYRQLTISVAAFLLCGAIFIGTRLFVQSASNELAVKNQTLTLDIDSRTAKIESLKSEITKLQEKSRVLGMLEGQVYDNKNNVYYYGD